MTSSNLPSGTTSIKSMETSLLQNHELWKKIKLSMTAYENNASRASSQTRLKTLQNISGAFLKHLKCGSSSLLLGGCLSPLPEIILEATRHVTQVSHSSCSSSLSPNGFDTPVVFTDALWWVGACRTSTLLDMKTAATTPDTKSVGLISPLTKTSCSLAHCCSAHRLLRSSPPSSQITEEKI
jgi:hypothetical protein